MQNAQYQCLMCEHTQTMQWMATADEFNRCAPPAMPKLACPKCGALMAPAQVLARVRQASYGPVPGQTQTEDLFEVLFRQFSNCPEARECHLIGLYGDRCELGQLMPKCLTHLRFAIEDAKRTPAVSQTLPPTPA